MKLIDQIGNELLLDTIPKRIICLVPSISELLVDLGLQNAIVGVTKFCVHPKSLRKEKTVVGGTKNISVDKIAKLKPDIIICNKEENTKEIVAKCKEITTTYVSDIYTIADTLQLIHDFGRLFSCDVKAKTLILEIQQKNNDFLEFIRDKKPKRVAYFIWKNPWMIAANKTFINHLLENNNFENVFKERIRYPEIQLSELKEIQDLDCIFLSSEPYPFKEKDLTSLQEEFKNVEIILVDGEYFSWYGTRLLYAFNYFKQLHTSLLNSNFSI
ncbi:ABC transporter substrate-binding protein [Polaribacter porphyrae]|uniref:Cobalamin-binding protein n=1 Tax=Polaribacter porphyrae TaxID=1137780 RepID=A0A2S7WTJ0_9FLAO|nr:helical backbone metal receptor [Polaribacter porphyrae]PQJ80796.1 cobalamin-binding protein [Polaribacter porphyrae]